MSLLVLARLPSIGYSLIYVSLMSLTGILLLVPLSTFAQQVSSLSPASVSTPTPNDGPVETLVPGLMDGATTAAYNAARTPVASIAFAVSGGVSTLTEAIQPVLQGGVSTQISLPLLSQKLGSGSASATVTLNYGVARTGQLVWVQVLHGGTLTAVDDAGKFHTASNGGFIMSINVLGTIIFTFQAPPVSDIYRVYTRLENVATTLQFEVSDPNP